MRNKFEFTLGEGGSALFFGPPPIIYHKDAHVAIWKCGHMWLHNDKTLKSGVRGVKCVRLKVK